jgi:hypothetical protein
VAGSASKTRKQYLLEIRAIRVLRAPSRLRYPFANGKYTILLLYNDFTGAQVEAPVLAADVFFLPKAVLVMIRMHCARMDFANTLLRIVICAVVSFQKYIMINFCTDKLPISERFGQRS